MESKSISNEGFVLWMDKTIGQIGILNGDCGSVVKNLPAVQETRVQSLGWEDPLEKEMATTPVFLPGEFHGQRSLVGCSPQGHKESDTTEQLTHTHGDCTHT